MAICKFCKKDMLITDGCIRVPVIIDKKPFEQIKFGDEEDDWGQVRCGDCNCKKGEYHHANCDIERCPKCKGQLLSCGCIDTED